MTHRDLPLLGYDAIEYWVGNAKQAAHFYRSAFGFRLVGYAGPETGVRDRASYVLQQGAIRFVFTSALRADHEIARHVTRHGDGIRDVAFRVADAADAFELAVERGARPHARPRVDEDDHGKVQRAAIRTYGDTIHTFVQRDDYSGVHLPGYREVAHDPVAAELGLATIDHVVGNVAYGEMDTWAEFYQRILGFSQLRHFGEDDISTEYSALMSKVLWDGDGRIKMPINEPAEGRKRSQIEEYLDAYDGPGVQHLALTTDDIVGTVRAMQRRGVGFLPVPDEYYLDARQRVGDVGESWDDLAALGILVDRDEEGYLLQIFTEPVQDRPTVFYEIIQRHGSRGFGAGNFKALFEAIERAQARRGNL
ncbi:4-hydroxyphenylpyruvate dioxygenase [Egicoccus sp. AB-alg6-2]|uniref:4-hydroxyphenylpyruvate dioxygenase n=1 Tax=Egicoccus sp. AB-alg6-2 TaxID=3242692 RepID=UPI00359EAF14